MPVPILIRYRLVTVPPTVNRDHLGITRNTERQSSLVIIPVFKEHGVCKHTISVLYTPLFAACGPDLSSSDKSCYNTHGMKTSKWFLYVLRCADGTLYTGVTTDLARRVTEHNSGRGARYTAGRRPVALLAAWRFPDRGAAQRAEARFRRLSQARKLALAGQGLSFEGSPFWDH